MSHSCEIGYLASALVLAAFGMKDMVNLRIVAICSNFAFIAYALALRLEPVLLLHVILLPLNCWRLTQAWQASEREMPFGGAPLARVLSGRRGSKQFG